MIRRITAGLMAAFLVLMMSVPSFASVASASEIGVENDTVDDDIFSLDDSSVSGMGMGDDAASSDTSTAKDGLEDDSVDSGLDDTDTSSASGSVDVPVVPTWQEAVEAVKAKRASASASEADIRTLDLMDDDYGIMLMSSVGTVENTVDRTGVSIKVGYYAPGSSKVSWKDGYIKPNGEFELSLPDGSKLSAFELWFNRTALPPAGKYTFSADMSSHISFDWRECRFNGVKKVNNVAQNLVYKVINFNSSSGDVYIPPLNVDLGMVDFIAITLYPTEPMNDLISGSLRFRFQAYSGDQIDVITPGVGDVAQDYQAGVSSSLGSIGDTLEEIVETISLQLEALWNQMYNYIHLPEYEKLEQIRQAIENIRLDVDVDNQDVVNKLDEQISNDNANTQQITNGYDKTGLTDSNSKLDDTFTQQDEQEQQIWEQIEEPLEEFEFKNPITQYLTTFLLFGHFLQDLFDSSGAFADVINLSFVITIALMVVGLYRFKGGN